MTRDNCTKLGREYFPLIIQSFLVFAIDMINFKTRKWGENKRQQTKDKPINNGLFY